MPGRRALNASTQPPVLSERAVVLEKEVPVRWRWLNGFYKESRKSHY